MAELTSKQKLLVIERLACFSSASEIIAELQTQGVNASFAQIAYYDPNSLQSKGLKQEWIDLFRETRKRFVENALRVPIANQAYRLRDLQELRDRARESNNPRAWREALKMAREEMGDGAVDKNEVSVNVNISNPFGPMTDAEIDRRIQELEGTRPAEER